MSYFFYSKNDSKKEPISKKDLIDLIEAVEYFSKLKRLSEKEFLKIYSIGIEKDDRPK
jgi:hypothetical protein